MHDGRAPHPDRGAALRLDALSQFRPALLCLAMGSVNVVAMPKSRGSGWPEDWWSEWACHFENEPFLTEAEWRTYLNRMPVRYAERDFRKARPPSGFCEVCGQRDAADNPLQVAHRIPFREGVRDLALTPTFLDHPDRLKWAHRKECNDAVAMRFVETVTYLRRLGIDSLPSFLPAEVRRAWDSTA